MSRLPRRLAPFLLAAAAAAPLAGCGDLSLSRAAGVPTSLASHQLCSAVFVAGLDPEQFYREAVAPQIAPVGFLMRYRVDREQRAVTASFAGLLESRAVYRGPLGCLVLHGAPPPDLPIEADQADTSLLPPLAGPAPVEPADPALKAALDRAFTEADAPPYRQTKAVVIVHDGRIVAERYAPGYGVETPIMGWSMTKSITNALLGILVRQQKLRVEEPAPIAAWSKAGDPRHAITIDQLLRMTSGLDIGQSLISSWSSAFDASAQMLFDEGDMAAFAEASALATTPGSAWKYTDGNTLLLSRVIRDQVGGDAVSVVRFARRELFDKLGMRGVTLEFDGAGTPIGSSHMWAPARDWARFGLLYLADGVAGGERILPAGWVDYSARLTPGSEHYGYGASFWTNRGDNPAARTFRPGMPADSFMARGSEGQYVVIVPSAHLVVVRLGYAFTPRDDMATVDRLVADALAATKAE